MMKIEEKFFDLINESKNAGMNLNDIIGLVRMLYKEQ